MIFERPFHQNDLLGALVCVSFVGLDLRIPVEYSLRTQMREDIWVQNVACLIEFIISRFQSVQLFLLLATSRLET